MILAVEKGIGIDTSLERSDFASCGKLVVTAGLFAYDCKNAKGP